jgi:hypothetical protein
MVLPAAPGFVGPRIRDDGRRIAAAGVGEANLFGHDSHGVLTGAQPVVRIYRALVLALTDNRAVKDVKLSAAGAYVQIAALA